MSETLSDPSTATAPTGVPPRPLLERYGGAVPRYTSYPTAPHFHDGVDAAAYADWLAALPEDRPISLYAHIPFCDTLCWFCGCQTKITRRYGPVAQYLDRLTAEIARIAEHIGAARPPAGHIHWGGGSPTMLRPADIARLAAATDAAFERTADCVFSVEIDPRGLAPDSIDAFAAAGVTRASIGLQDVDPTVQAAINRVQSCDETGAVARRLRAAGIRELNLDLMYGLPYQTVAHVRRSVDAALALAPDRLALFGYAHVPWMKRHQRLIPEEALPGAEARVAQAEAAAEALEAAGYVRVGLDHFARPDDPLARAQTEGRLHRNFQGYTTDDAETLIGFGASAIGRTPQGYVQNETATDAYARAIDAGRLATARGRAFTADDRLMAAAIERVMCQYAVDLGRLAAAHAAPADAFAAARERLAPLAADGLVDLADDAVTVTERGRPFVRQVAACFDRYLGAGTARHSKAV